MSEKELALLDLMEAATVAEGGVSLHCVLKRCAKELAPLVNCPKPKRLKMAIRASELRQIYETEKDSRV